MFKKFLSRKLLVVIITAITDILIVGGSIPAEVQDLLLKLVTGLGALYVAVEGVKDIVVAIKNKLTP
jgi:hypothetical protein